jgi:hypothetical protein
MDTAKIHLVPKPEIDTEFALATLRTVVARLKLIESEVSAIGVALKSGTISARTAINLIDEIAPGCFGVVADTMGGNHE